MMVQLVKSLVTLNQGKNDEKKFYAFFLVLENGTKIRVKPNSFKDREGKNHSNYNELCLIADTDKLPF